MGEETNLKYFNELQFQTLTSYDIESGFISGKRKLANLMNKENVQTIITENKHKQLFNPNQNYSCQYYDEGEFIIKIEMAMTSFDCIETNHMTIRRVKIVNYLGLVIDVLLGIRQPKQNIPSHSAISLEDIMYTIH